MAAPEQIDLMKQDLKRSFDPIGFRHREIVKEHLGAMLKRGVTVKDVEPYFPGLRSDAQATGLYFICGVAEILTIETGRPFDDTMLEEIRALAQKINTPEMEPAALVDLVLERMPGSVTYKRPN